LGRLRGIATVVASAILFLALDLVQRTVIVGIIRVCPRSRARVLTDWATCVYRAVLWVPRHIGGAKINIRVKIPAEPGTLVVMNHQSLLDIPLVFACVDRGYPMVVARERYRRRHLVVSHMIRLYGHPTVRPGEHAAVQLEALRRSAAIAIRPVVIYPEGSRTRDGEVRPFKTAGLKAILSGRRWLVRVVVVDGVWRMAKLGGFVRHVSSAAIQVEGAGPFAFDPNRDDAESFCAAMEQQMIQKLAEMRSAAKH
jgi:1-acyl-sn-glycerol-3-phosphate acyltransferase